VSDDPDAHFYRVMFRARGTEAPDDGPDGLDFFFRLTELEDGTATPLRLSDDRMWLELMGDRTGFVKRKYSDVLQPGSASTTLEEDAEVNKADEALAAVRRMMQEVDDIGARITPYAKRLEKELADLARTTFEEADPIDFKGVSSSSVIQSSLLSVDKNAVELKRVLDLMVAAIDPPNAIDPPTARNKRAQDLLHEATVAYNRIGIAEKNFLHAAGSELGRLMPPPPPGISFPPRIKTKVRDMKTTGDPYAAYRKTIALAAMTPPTHSGGGRRKAAVSSDVGGATEGIDLGAAVYILTAVRSAAVAVGFVDIQNAAGGDRGGRWKAARAILIRDGAFGLAATLLMVAVAGGDPIALSVAFAVTWAVMALVVAAFVVADSAVADMRRLTRAQPQRQR
jgi:hypothetical protein